VQVLGIDIGGSGIKGAIVDTVRGQLDSERHRIETPKPATPQAVTQTVKELVAHFDWKGPIGCGLPAATQHGVAQTAANIDKAWIGTDARHLFQEATGCPVEVINDADAAGLAEATYGAGKDRNGLVLLLTIGTGIGSALINNGILVPNTEFGHLRFKGGIAEHYAADSIRKKEDLSWNEWGKRLDNYLHYLHRVCYPDLFILGGGVSKKFERYKDKITTAIPVIPAQLLNQAGIVGAAVAARQMVERQS